MSRNETRAILTAAIITSVLISSAARAAGEAQPAAAPAPAVASSAPVGPLIAGVCLLSRQDIVTRSKVGAAATARVNALQHAAQTEFDNEKSRLEARAAALRAKRPTSAAMQAQMQAQGQALNREAQQMQERASVRSRQLEATHKAAVDRVLLAADPYLDHAYAAHSCGLLFDKEVLISGNMGNDLTPEILAAMDAKVAPLTIELEPAGR